MPQSISQAQSSALADGFFDSFGSTDDELVTDSTSSALLRLAGGLVLQAQANLRQGGHISSGALADSLEVQEPTNENGILTVNITAATYAQFLNKGVKGTRGGSGAFQFKNANPSKAMVKAIAKWMQRGGRSTRNTKKQVSKLERKNKSIAELGAAYAVARSIKVKGIRKTGFLDNAIETTRKTAADTLGAAFKLDIINSIKN